MNHLVIDGLSEQHRYHSRSLCLKRHRWLLRGNSLGHNLFSLQLGTAALAHGLGALDFSCFSVIAKASDKGGGTLRNSASRLSASTTPST